MNDNYREENVWFYRESIYINMRSGIKIQKWN